MLDEAIRVRVRVSGRARRMRLLVHPDRTVELVAPRGVGAARIHELVERHRDWIERRVAACERPALGLELADHLWLDGRPVPVERRPGARPCVAFRDGQLRVGGCAAGAERAVERWYRRQARAAVEASARREGRRLDVTFHSLAIRDQRTRWGSCSATGVLSFSWRLVLAPREVLDYVVVHELCHLRQLNHSKAFWQLLDEARPGWREEAGWLRAHGWELRRYRPLHAPA